MKTFKEYFLNEDETKEQAQKAHNIAQEYVDVLKKEKSIKLKRWSASEAKSHIKSYNAPQNDAASDNDCCWTWRKNGLGYEFNTWILFTKDDIDYVLYAQEFKRLGGGSGGSEITVYTGGKPLFHEYKLDATISEIKKL